MFPKHPWTWVIIPKNYEAAGDPRPQQQGWSSSRQLCPEGAYSSAFTLHTRSSKSQDVWDSVQWHHLSPVTTSKCWPLALSFSPCPRCLLPPGCAPVLGQRTEPCSWAAMAVLGCLVSLWPWPLRLPRSHQLLPMGSCEVVVTSQTIPCFSKAARYMCPVACGGGSFCPAAPLPGLGLLASLLDYLMMSCWAFSLAFFLQLSFPQQPERSS